MKCENIFLIQKISILATTTNPKGSLTLENGDKNILKFA